MGRPENALQKACLEFLKLKGCLAWRNNTGAVKSDKRFIRYGHPGSGDVFAVVPPHGRFLSIECKAGKNKPTAKQVEWANEVRTFGGVAIVAYTLDDVHDALEAM